MRRCRTTGSGRRTAFTLVELLVVVAVILILFALLLPVFNTALERGYMVQCMGNIKQIGTALLLYAGDNSGILPSSGYTGDPSKSEAVVATGGGALNLRKGVIWPYLNGSDSARQQMFKCPSDTMVGWTYDAGNCINPSVATGIRYLSYSSNFQMYNNWPVHLPAIRNLGKKILVVDELRPNDFYFCWNGDCDDLGARRHFGSGWCFFGDGHAELFTPEFLWWNSAYFDLFL